MTTTASRADTSEPRPLASNADPSATEWTTAMRLIESVAAAKDQADAAMELVTELARLFPGTNVRCGLGGNRLSRLCDAKLGWLGPSSDGFQQMNVSWNDESGTPKTADDSVASHPQTLRLNVDESTGAGRCILLLQGQAIAERDRLWLRRSLPTLRLLLWKTPTDPFTRAGRWLGSRGTNTRVYLGLALMFLTLLVMWPVPYRVRCSAVVRPAESRVVAAPFAATLAQTHVMLGDTVKAGDPVVTLDGRLLRLELETIDAQIGQLNKERDIAMAGRRVAERQQAELKIRELSRQRDLVVDRLDRLV
ncbi:MAG: biotin/lipoyl-binding protein, partial [Planctomycetota bacterium]